MARQVAAVEPRSATAHLILGNLLREKGDLDLAIAALTKAAALFYVGARRLEHLRYLGGDPLVTRVCGLARLPARRTVADWLRQFTQETLAPSSP